MIASSGRKGERGYVLVSIVWLVGILAVAMAAMSVYSVNSLSVVASSRDRLALQAMTRGAVEAAVLEMLRTPAKQAVRGDTQVRFAAGEANVDWSGEGGRIDLNFAPDAMIANLISRFVDEERDAAALTQIILDRRPKKQQQQQQQPGAPATGGPANPQPAATRNADPLQADASKPNVGPFRHVGELTLAGFPDALVKKLAPFATIYGGSAKIDPRLASKTVLSLLPDMTEGRLRELLELRASGSTDQTAWIRAAGSAAGEFLSLDPGPSVRVRVDARLQNGYRARTELVIVAFSDDQEPYRVVDWEDQTGAPPTDSLDGDL